MDPNYMPQWERDDHEAEQHRKHEREINRPRFTEVPPSKKIEHDLASKEKRERAAITLTRTGYYCRFSDKLPQKLEAGTELVVKSFANDVIDAYICMLDNGQEMIVKMEDCE